MRLIYIAGAGRSGSTLLGNILGQIPGVAFVGDLTHVWRRGLLSDELCGCGERFSECDFWQNVLRAAFPSGLRYAPAELAQIHDAAVGEDALRSTIRVVRPRPALQRRYAELLSSLYRGIAEVSDANIIVDSSKYPADAVLLRDHLSSRLELFILHLIRECGAVVHSWSKRMLRPEVVNRSEFMATYPWYQSASAWLIFNAIFDRFAGDERIEYHRLLYEDLVARPHDTLAQLATWLDLDSGSLPLKEDNTVMLRRTHTVTGNPSRFRTGRVQLKLDREWIDAMPWTKRSMLKLLTGWKSSAYGYDGLSSSR